MFAFEKNVSKAFRKVGRDFKSLKSNLNEWVLFLNGNQRELKMKVMELERRLERIESRLETREIEVLRRI